MSAVLADVVWVAHALFTLWAVVAPFTNQPHVLVAHLVVTPLVWCHWLANDDSTCALSMLEAWLRGVPVANSWVHQLVGPIYGLNQTSAGALVWAASVGLWLVTLSKVLRDPGMIGRAFRG